MKYQSNQILMVAYRDIKYGVDGMVTGSLPPFTDEARDFLCKDPDAFRRFYGTHYVQGEIKGASIDMRIEVSTSSSEKAQSLSANLEAGYSGFGFSAKASAGLDQALKQSNDVKSSRTMIMIRGGDRGKDVVQSMEITEATQAIL